MSYNMRFGRKTKKNKQTGDKEKDKKSQKTKTRFELAQFF